MLGANDAPATRDDTDSAPFVPKAIVTPSHTTVRQALVLGRDDLQALLRGTYRGARQSHTAQVGALDTLSVTLASDVMTFRPRR